jgi:hypothetical protein
MKPLRLLIILTALTLLLFALTPTVNSQAPTTSGSTKSSGTLNCLKDDVTKKISIGDLPSGSFKIIRGKCSWSTPLEIEGIQSKGGVYTAFEEFSGNKGSFRGYYTETMSNGDKITWHYEGTYTVKDGVPQNVDIEPTVVSGTGKFQALKAQTKCTRAVAPTVCPPRRPCGQWAVEYELPK